MPTPPDAVRVRVPAKINLVLAVGDRRPDGFHELTTVFHAVELFDVVSATPAPALSVTCDDGSVPRDAGNLAWLAARSIASVAGRAAEVAVHIEKSIPVAGGMAGGSADAAATLVACNELWQAGLDRTALAGLAAGLGSDVPFALFGGTAVGTGRGERLEPVACPELHWVLVPSVFGIAAGEAYRRLDTLRVSRPGPRAGADAMLAALPTGDPDLIAAAMANDLQEPAVALRGELAPLLARVREAGALAAMVSGSGPTIAGLCRSAAHAADVAAALLADGVAASTTCGPAAGATVIR